MRAHPSFNNLDKEFWAHIRLLSQKLGYTERGTGNVYTPTIAEITQALLSEKLTIDHIVNNETTTEYGNEILNYFSYRANILNTQVRNKLMDLEKAKLLYEKILSRQKYQIPPVRNKQKGDKQQIAYLSTITNMLIESKVGSQSFDYDPRQLTLITMNNRPLRTLSRRMDGAFPSVINPIAVWEIKEYYHTTTFGSRIADGVFETLLDGMEIEEMRLETGVEIEHVLIIDAYYTWWECGRSYLCRLIDLLNMGYVDELLFGSEIEETLPLLVQKWINKRENASIYPKVNLDISN